MGSIRDIALLTCALLLALLPSSGRAGPAAPDRSRGGESSLFAQSAAEALNRDFSDRDISFLLLDAHTGRMLASRWERIDSPIPLGSLVKPFTALAYGDLHGFHYPALPVVEPRPAAGCLAGTVRSDSLQRSPTPAIRTSACSQRT